LTDASLASDQKRHVVLVNGQQQQQQAYRHGGHDRQVDEADGWEAAAGAAG